MKYMSIFFSLFVLISIPLYVSSFPGVLDPTFGLGTGTVTTDISTINTGNTVAIQSDGKIIVAGYAFIGANNDFALARYNPDGTLDTTFNQDGLLPGTVTTAIAGDDRAYAVAIQEDGKIIAAGEAAGDFALVRYNPNGTLDTTFGTGGIVITPIGTTDAVFAIAMQGDGKIIAAGLALVGVGQIALARYNTNGSLDTSFGTDGIVTTDIGGSTSQANAIAIQPCDGKIVVAGHAFVGGSFDFALARYNTNGSLDSSFGTGGIVTTDFAGDTDMAQAVAIQENGKIVAIGIAGDDFGLARYNTNGSLDSSFGIGGIVTTDFAGGADLAFAGAIQDDGKIVAAGRALVGGINNFALARYNADGVLDASFNPTGSLPGTVTTQIGDSSEVSGVALQADGKIVAAGTGNEDEFAVARYLNNTLIITKEASTENPCPGQNITYTITVTNTGAGGGTVNGIFLEDVLPEELIFRSAQTSGEASSFDQATGVWNIPYIRVGKQAQLIIKARVGQFAGNQIICNTAITTYSSVDEVTNSSLFDSLGISTTEVFSTTECVSTSPVIYENLNHIVDRIDCGIDDVQMNLNALNEQVIRIDAKSAELNDKLNIALLKLNNVIELFFISEVDCLFP